jgi:predicted metal-binding protein
MDKNLLEQQLSELPLYTFFYIDPAQLEFSDRIRYICQAECPRYGKSWACPPGVGSVTECKAKCLGYQECLVVGTITECLDIADIDETLATRPEHEKLTDQVADMLRDMGVEPYVLSTDSCAICTKCTYPQGQPCRHGDKMHPCIESHGINLIPTLEENGLEFQYGGNIVTWYSLLFFND